MSNNTVFEVNDNELEALRAILTPGTGLSNEDLKRKLDLAPQAFGRVKRTLTDLTEAEESPIMFLILGGNMVWFPYPYFWWDHESPHDTAFDVVKPAVDGLIASYEENGWFDALTAGLDEDSFYYRVCDLLKSGARSQEEVIAALENIELKYVKSALARMQKSVQGAPARISEKGGRYTLNKKGWKSYVIGCSTYSKYVGKISEKANPDSAKPSAEMTLAERETASRQSIEHQIIVWIELLAQMLQSDDQSLKKLEVATMFLRTLHAL